MIFVGEAFRNEHRLLEFMDGDDRSVIGGEGGFDLDF
jgi:hypothetical protein